MSYPKIFSREKYVFHGETYWFPTRCGRLKTFNIILSVLGKFLFPCWRGTFLSTKHSSQTNWMGCCCRFRAEALIWRGSEENLFWPWIALTMSSKQQQRQEPIAKWSSILTIPRTATFVLFWSISNFKFSSFPCMAIMLMDLNFDLRWCKFLAALCTLLAKAVYNALLCYKLYLNLLWITFN